MTTIEKAIYALADINNIEDNNNINISRSRTRMQLYIDPNKYLTQLDDREIPSFTQGSKIKKYISDIAKRNREYINAHNK